MTKHAIDERIKMYCKPHQIEAYQLHISGHSAKEISVIQNLSLESVKRSLIRVNSISQQSNEWWFGLSLRAKNALKKDTDIV